MIILAVELVIVGICILISKYMIEKRKGLSKITVWGRDDDETVKEMEKIAREIVTTGKYLIDGTIDKYEIETSIKNGLIDQVKVKTEKTFFTLSRDERGNYQKSILNVAFSKNGAIATWTLCLWCYIHFVLFIVICFLLIILLKLGIVS